jgi:intracellular multiplication protein IcmK
MPLKSLHWARIGIAGIGIAMSYAALAQQSPPSPGNTLPPSARSDVDSAIPLTPGMIRDLGKRVGDNRRAEEEVNTEIASPISRRVNVSFAPGQSTSIVRIVKGYPTALSFFDKTGQPWPIEWDTNSNPAGQSNNGNCNQGPAGGGGPAVASAGFYVCTPTVGSNVLQ